MKKSLLMLTHFLLFFIHNTLNSSELNLNLEIKKGERYFKEKKFRKASILFEQMLEKKNKKKSFPIANILYQLGWCYLELGKNETFSNKFQQKNLFKAEENFLKLQNHEDSEHATLALAQTLILEGKKFNDPLKLKQAESLLADEKGIHAMILRAETGQNYKKREKLYEKALNTFPTSGIGWYLRGINELSEGKIHCKNAANHFETAFNILYPKDKEKAALCLKHQSEVLASLGKKEGYLKSLSLLNALLTQYRQDLLPLLDEPGEIYYLRGLISSKLFEEDRETAFFEIGRKSLIEGYNKYPAGKYAATSLKTLGILYAAAEQRELAHETFLKLESTEQAAEALFWAATTAPSAEIETDLFRRVYENHPFSSFADEAYYRVYPYEEYLSGNREAVAHLSKFDQRFPDSPYRILAYYLQGTDVLAKNPEKGKELLKRAALISEEGGQKEYFHSVKTRAKLAWADSLSGEKNYIDSAKIYSEVFNEYKDQFSPLMEESGYSLAKNLRLAGEEDSAQNTIDYLLEKFKSQRMTRGYHLSLSWYEDGMLAMKAHDLKRALKSFLLAEEAAKGRVLHTEELLEIWIQQSLCYRELNMIDEAMLVLSRIINYDAVSSLRLQAMFLRAEIYELQGRRELAHKQLDAIASKGGEWAGKATLKLEEEYEYQ